MSALRARLPRSSWLVAAYAFLIVLMSGVVFLKPDLATLWAVLMLPVFGCALLFARRLQLVLLAMYVVSSFVVIFLASHNIEASFVDTVGFLIVVIVASELLYRFAGARERAEQRLLASEQRFRTLSAVAPVGIFQIDAEGSCVYTNGCWQEITGQSPEESLGDGWIDAIHADDKPAVLLQWNHAAKMGTGFEREFRVQSSRGESRWVSCVSNPMLGENDTLYGRVGTLEDITGRMEVAEALRDTNDALEARVLDRTSELVAVIHQLEQEITERTRTEVQLHHSEERFSTAFHSSPSAIVISSAVDGSLIDANDAFLELVGYSKEAVLGSTLTELALWDTFEDRDRLALMLQEQGRVRDFETSIARPTGERRRVLASVERVTLDGVPCLLSIATDITERKATESRLKTYADSQTQLLHQVMTAQERERRRLSMDIHDGPLQSLGVATMALDRATRRQARNEHDLAQGELTGLRATLSETVAELRSVLADLSVESLTSQGLGHALGAHVKRFSDITGIQVDLQAKVAERLPAQLELLIYRLAQEALANIRKHSQAQHVVMQVHTDSDYLWLTIYDDGQGFDPEKVYGSEKEGEKLGLLSMRECMAAVGGDMVVFSHPGEGTRLEFHCPLPALPFHLSTERLNEALLVRSKA